MATAGGHSHCTNLLSLLLSHQKNILLFHQEFGQNKFPESNPQTQRNLIPYKERLQAEKVVCKCIIVDLYTLNTHFQQNDPQTWSQDQWIERISL